MILIALNISKHRQHFFDFHGYLMKSQYKNYRNALNYAIKVYVILNYISLKEMMKNGKCLTIRYIK